MRRTQILLEPRQYYFVRDEAKLRNTSLSALIRQWIDQRMELAQPENLDNDPFWELAGIISDDPDVARDHDKYIYRIDWREQDET